MCVCVCIDVCVCVCVCVYVCGECHVCMCLCECLKGQQHTYIPMFRKAESACPGRSRTANTLFLGISHRRLGKFTHSTHYAGLQCLLKHEHMHAQAHSRTYTQNGFGTVWEAVCVECLFWTSVLYCCLCPCASASRAEGPGFESRLRRDFFGVESYQWLKNWHSSGYPARRLAL